MTKRKSDTELARADTIDILRTKERLRARIELRHRLNALEADVMDEFDKRVAEGLPYKPVLELEG